VTSSFIEDTPPTTNFEGDTPTTTYGGDTPTTTYGGDTNTYGGGTTTTRCTPYDEVKYVNKCFDYTDRVCYTTHSEKCKNVVGQTCHAQVSSSQRRPCYDVTEKVCTLKEEVKYEVVDVVITVQKCSKVPERVCNTIYVMDWTESYRNQCINVTNLVCSTQERTVFEKTCHFETKYDCDTGTYGSTGGYVQPKPGYESIVQPDSGYGSITYSAELTSSAGGQVQETSYQSTEYDHAAEVACEKRVDKRCRTNPRQLSTQYCSERQDEVCERVNYRTPRPVEKEQCHNEDKKVCHVVQTTQPKQIKKYNYTKVCRPLRKRICENTDLKKLVPSCTPSTRPECYITPSETCEDIPKRYCAKVPITVRHEKCETVTTSINPYANPDDDGGYGTVEDPPTFE